MGSMAGIKWQKISLNSKTVQQKLCNPKENKKKMNDVSETREQYHAVQQVTGVSEVVERKKKNYVKK